MSRQRKKKGDAVSGWINLDKPLDLGSTDAVSRIKRLYNAQKAGHAGTLDPLASGVLPIALGEATKTVPFLMEAEKSYRFTVEWGRSTASFDREGEETGISDVRPTVDQVEAALPPFRGEILQVPPNFSAIKVDGQRAYDLAREGVAFELEARPIFVRRLAVTASPDADHVTLEMDCGKGSYVRAIVRDLASALSAHGHVSELRRTRVGAFTEENATPLEKLCDLEYADARQEALLPVETALDDIPALALTTEDAFRLKQGRSVVLVPRQVEELRARLRPRTIAGHDGERTVLTTFDGRAHALCELRAGRISPTRIFHLDQES
jgi:tRNA pseudouridine55 synthase